MQPFREALAQRVILFDGAMGTDIYNRGVFINRCYEEVNLASADLITDVHRTYLEAGAEVMTANTYGANHFRLVRFGLEDRHDEINAAGVRLARAAAGDKAWVAGSIGPIGAELAPVGKISPGEAFSAFRAQATVLAAEGVDLFVLETFHHVTELWQAVRAVRAVCDLPIVACLSFPISSTGSGRLVGHQPETAIATMNNWDLDAIGTNCANGPRGILDIIERISKLTDLPLAAMPNAGLPQEVDGRTIYLAGPEYMAEYARRMAQLGVRIIGGCCGTTPQMIREMRTFLRSVSPAHSAATVVHVESSKDVEPEPQGEEPIPASQRTDFARKLLGGKFCVSVELDPPRGIEPKRAVEGAHMLYNKGIDVVNIADGPRAIARMGPTALSHLVQIIHPARWWPQTKPTHPNHRRSLVAPLRRDARALGHRFAARVVVERPHG